MDTITITKPDDWHLHLRDGKTMADVVGHSAQRFARAIIMPNLQPPVCDTESALAYHGRIISSLADDSNFTPLMTLYLTDSTSVEEIRKAKACGKVAAVKLYPAGATTNSASGVTDILNCQATLEAMAEEGLPLLVHGEVTSADIDIFDREHVFIEKVLQPLTRRIPSLKIVFEHITTSEAAQFVNEANDNIAATITPQHLLLNRNALLVGGIHPHNYCLPVLKREKHREALVKAATSGSSKFFLGTDSAPHPQGAKESACGCAGIYSAHAAIELYAEAFDQVGAINKLEGFASHHGPDFYDLPRNTQTTTLIKQPWSVPQTLPFGNEQLVPMRAGETIAWQIEK